MEKIEQEYLRCKEVCALIGIGNSTFWRWEKEPDFPKKYQLSSRCTVWKKAEIVDFIESRRTGITL